MQQENQSSLKRIISIIGNRGKNVDKNVLAIDIQNYTKRFGNFVSTKNVNLKVNHGVIHGFIGPNGSGKTTTIKALIGAYIVKEGEVKINGFKAGSEEANRLIGYIPERASFPKHLNCLDYLISMAEISGMKRKDAHKRAEEILEALGLSNQATRKPITFSSGMQKKILLAQSLLTDPSILILDEPAANLDPSARKELFDQLIELRNNGKTIFISSHILAELERLIDEISFIYYGEMLYSGKVDAFIKKGQSIFVKSNDNIKLTKFLEKNKYKWIGDINNEIEIINVDSNKAQDFYTHLSDAKVEIISFRTNDLQTAYEELAFKANKEKRGKQTLKIRKTIISKLKEWKERDRNADL